MVPPGAVASGFLYVNLDLGAKAFNVDLIGTDGLHSYQFVMLVPGFTADYARTDFDALYGPDAIETLDEPALRA